MMKLKELVKNWFAYIDAQNFEGIKSLMDAQHKFHNPMTPEPAGVDEHLGMMQMMTGAFQGRHHIDILVEEGNRVAVYGRWSGKHIGEFNGVPAMGNTLTFTWADVFQIDNGKVVNEYFEMNPMSIMAQITTNN